MLVVVGGHSRNIGKTSVVAGLVRGLSERPWTAVKVTQFGHGVCSLNGHSCHCSLEEHPFAIQEEHDRSGRTDTSRFLVAGARQSLWVRTRQGMLHQAMPALRKRLAQEPYIIIESNSIMRFLEPDLYLVVLDYATADFKASAKEYLHRADAYILLESHAAETPRWSDVTLKLKPGQTLFKVTPDRYVTPEILEFVRARILAEEKNDRLNIWLDRRVRTALR